jgi:hypothetical protein
MPFLEGIPCSIHGIVFANEVITIRPVEMVTLRTRQSEFFYAGCASWWDPPPSDRDDMRDLARRVGVALRDEVQYRGAFTIDGVMTSHGFRPTELNPRNGAGLNLMTRGCPIPLQLILDALVGGCEIDWRPAELEAGLLEYCDAHRVGGTWRALSMVLAPATGSAGYDSHLGTVQPATDVDADLDFSIGPSSIGSFVRCGFRPARTPTGASAGPEAVAMWAYLDVTYGLGIGPLESARPVR